MFKTVFSVSVLIFCTNAISDNYLELKLLHVIFRHGIRTPADTYPKDPYITESFYPTGWGYLTNPGKLQMYNIGQYIRNRYNDFLGDYYNDKILYARATDSDRTIASAQMMCAGLWPPKRDQIWGELKWQPVPVRCDPLNEDNLLLVRKPCAQYHMELDKIMAEGEIKKKLEENENVFCELSQITGLNIKDFDDVQSLYSTLKAEEMYGLKLPQWTKKYYPDILQPLTDYSYIINSYNDKLKRLKGGVFLKKLLVDWHQVANETTNESSDLIQLLKSKQWINEASEYGNINNERKIFLYGGHDSTITNLLRALDIWDIQTPDYGITVIFELLKDLDTKQHGVKIFLRNSTTTEPYLLTIPGCDIFCPLQYLTGIVDKIIPRNLTEECFDPYYIPPELGGP